MMEVIMASENVAQEIKAIHSRMDRIDDVVEKISEAIHQISVVIERQNHSERALAELKADMKRGFDKVEDKISKQDEKIEKSNAKILYWSGGLATLVFVIGMVVAVIRPLIGA